jgi:hypothetical protein
MTSFIAAIGSGRSTSVIPAVPAASSVTTIAFIRHLTVPSRVLDPRHLHIVPCVPQRCGLIAPPHSSLREHHDATGELEEGERLGENG